MAKKKEKVTKVVDPILQAQQLLMEEERKNQQKTMAKITAILEEAGYDIVFETRMRLQRKR